MYYMCIYIYARAQLDGCITSDVKLAHEFIDRKNVTYNIRTFICDAIALSSGERGYIN